MDIILGFRQINNKLESNMNDNLKEFGITLSQLNILLFIYKNNSRHISQKEICEFLGVKHSSLIDVLKRLESKGLVLRLVNKEDARSNSVVLTQKSIELVSSIKNNKITMSEQILKDFSQEEKCMLEDLLNKVINNLERR